MTNVAIFNIVCIYKSTEEKFIIKQPPNVATAVFHLTPSIPGTPKKLHYMYLSFTNVHCFKGHRHSRIHVQSSTVYHSTVTHTASQCGINVCKEELLISQLYIICLAVTVTNLTKPTLRLQSVFTSHNIQPGNRSDTC